MISVIGATIQEGTTHRDPYYLDFVVTLSAAAAEAVTVDYRTLSASAQIRGDTYSSNGTLTFAPGETSKTLSVRINADSGSEPDEAVVLELYDPSANAALAGEAPSLRATGWILDDDGSGEQRALFVSSPQVVEGDSGQREALFEVSLSRPAETAFTLSYQTRDGSARAGEDYTAVSGTLEFAPGQRTAAVAVPINGDSTLEPSERFTLVVTPPEDLALADLRLGEATLLDDDAGGAAVPVLSVADVASREGTTHRDPYYLDFVVTLSAAAAEAVTVDYRTLSASAQIRGG